MPTPTRVPEPKPFFLDRFALDERVLEDTIGTAIARKADFADLYFEFRISEGFALEDGIDKKAAKNNAQDAVLDQHGAAGRRAFVVAVE